MTAVREVAPSEIVRRVPDEPQWVDLRTLLLGGRCRVLTAADPGLGAVAVPHSYPFVAVWGDPGPVAVAAALVGDAERSVLLDPAARPP